MTVPATPVVAKKPTIFSSVEAWGFAHWTYLVTAAAAFAIGMWV